MLGPETHRHGFRPLAVQCESEAPPGPLGEYGPARPVADVEELKILIGELRGSHAGDDVECARQLHLRAGDEAHGLSRIVGVELELDCVKRVVVGSRLSTAGSAIRT